MPRGRYPARRRSRVPAASLQSEYLIRWYGGELHTHPERFPRLISPDLFGNQQPLELEVGCGTGEFLCGLAARTPQVNYVGVDTSLKSLYRAVEQAAEYALTNVRFIKANIKLLYPLLLPDSLPAVYLHYPVPEMTSKERRRGVISQAFLDQVQRALVPTGRLSIMTDEVRLFAELLELARADRRFAIVPEGQFRLQLDEELKSHHQRFWEARGRPPMRFEIEKLPG